MFVVKEIAITAPALKVELPKGSKILGTQRRENLDPIVLVEIPFVEGVELPKSTLELYTLPSGSGVKLSKNATYIGSFEVPLPEELIENNKKSGVREVSMAIHVYYEWEGSVIL